MASTGRNEKAIFVVPVYENEVNYGYNGEHAVTNPFSILQFTYNRTTMP